MQAPEISHHCSADHNVMEVSNDEISVGNVNVDAQCREEQTSETAHGEQAQEAVGVEHGGVVVNGSLVHGGSPVENLHRRGYGNRVTEQREDERGVDGDAGDEH